MNEALIILGDQLFPPDFYLPHQNRKIFMAEDVGLCTHFKYHKHKLIFFLSSMRTYADELKTRKFQVHYEKLSERSFVERLGQFLKDEKITKVFLGEVSDKFFQKELEACFKDHQVALEIFRTPMFICSRENFSQYLKTHKRPFMKNFYEGERKRLKLMVDEQGKPWGGKWSFDDENRNKAPKILTNKTNLIFPDSENVIQVKKIIDDRFADHPGVSLNFWLPTSREESLKVLQHFLRFHLKDFGSYQDSITARSPFLYHSLLSPMLNNGLITPREVIAKSIQAYDKSGGEIPLHSLEGFIRQIMGWREFVRGIYDHYSEEQEKSNFFQHHNRLTNDWYQGTTGIPPLDDAIQKVQNYGYGHHIERLMILSNVMLLSEVHPLEVHKWFMEMYVDSADWVMGPNVFGMGQFSDGGIFATKPYISGSNYLLKMSDYKKGEWCDVWDGLFWRFIGKHAAFFSRQPRLNFMVKTLEKMDDSRKQMLFGKAEEFIRSKTIRPTKSLK